MSGAKITSDDIKLWGQYAYEYFADVLNGEYTLTDAVSDIRSLIGSQFDSRAPQNIIEGVEQQPTTRKACHYDCDDCHYALTVTARCSMCIRKDGIHLLWSQS